MTFGLTIFVNAKVRLLEEAVLKVIIPFSNCWICWIFINFIILFFHVLYFLIEMSEELVLRFHGNDYIEYVMKERFKRDYLLKDLLEDEKEGNTRDQSGINIKLKTQDNGVLIFVVGQTGHTMLEVSRECNYRDIYSVWIYV